MDKIERKSVSRRTFIKRLKNRPWQFAIRFKSTSAGKKVFLKVGGGFNNYPVPSIKDCVDRESTALKILKGLAVPTIVSIPRNEVRRLVKQASFHHIATELLPGRDCVGRKFNSDNALGLWAFALEQLCAFRRLDILCYDIKTEHLFVNEELDKAWIIDFDRCCLLEPSGKYDFVLLGLPVPFSPPEIIARYDVTESVIVYQMGMMLGCLLFGNFSNHVVNTVGLKAIGKRISQISPELSKFLVSSIAADHKNRPQTLEELFEKFKELRLPEKSLDLWTKLREPYIKKLNKLKFFNPSDARSPKLAA